MNEKILERHYGVYEEMSEGTFFKPSDYLAIMEDDTKDIFDDGGLFYSLMKDERIIRYTKERDISNLLVDFDLCDDMTIENKRMGSDIPFQLESDCVDNFIEYIAFNEDVPKENTLERDVVILYATLKNIVVNYTNELERRDLFLTDTAFMYMAFLIYLGHDVGSVIRTISRECNNDEEFIEEVSLRLDITIPTVIQFFETEREYHGF